MAAKERYERREISIRGMALGGPALSSICIWGLQVIHLCLCFDFFHYVSIGGGSAPRLQ